MISKLAPVPEPNRQMRRRPRLPNCGASTVNVSEAPYTPATRRRRCRTIHAIRTRPGDDQGARGVHSSVTARRAGTGMSDAASRAARPTGSSPRSSGLRHAHEAGKLMMVPHVPMLLGHNVPDCSNGSSSGRCEPHTPEAVGRVLTFAYYTGRRVDSEVRSWREFSIAPAQKFDHSGGVGVSGAAVRLTFCSVGVDARVDLFLVPHVWHARSQDERAPHRDGVPLPCLRSGLARGQNARTGS